MPRGEAEYRDIPDVPNYRAGSDGSIWSRLWRVGESRSATPTWRQLTPTPGHKGRLRVSITVNGKTTPKYVHRLVALAFYGPLPDGLQTRHLDGNHLNNTPENLKYGTREENEDDKWKHGTHSRGEQHSLSRLTVSQVLEIRAMYTTGTSIYRIVRSTGVSKTHVRRIVHRQSWAHI